MSKMQLDELLALLDHTPIIADIHPVSICYLPDNVTIMDSAAEAAWILDYPKPTLPGRLLITAKDRMYNSRFLHVNCDHNPLTTALNDILFEKYDDVGASMLRQSQLSDHIASNVITKEMVILVLIDGLSFRDIEDWTNLIEPDCCIEPCFVDVPTVTHVAFPNALGAPTLSERLFDLGFYHRLGFTYWTREDNALTDRLFQAIPEVHKTSHFPHILATLREQFNSKGQDTKSYVQIVRTGLDGYAHSQRRRPPVSAVIDDIRQEFVSLIELCNEFHKKLGWQINLYLTADHGILWYDEFKSVVIGTAPARSSSRWCSWRELYHQEESGKRFMVGNTEYYCLGYPKLRRPPRIDEQGVHGGISFQESIVPFVTVRIE
jgi:hypothetical protein